MAWGRIEVVIELLDVLAVIAFAVGQPKHSLLQNRIALVPQRKAEAQTLLRIGETREPIFSPAVGATARVVVGKVIPGCTMSAVIFAHGAPLPLRQIGAPLLPAFTGREAVVKP